MMTGVKNARSRGIGRTMWSRWTPAAAALLLASVMLAGPASAMTLIEFIVMSALTNDSTLRAGDRNTNEGANHVLSLSGDGQSRIVVHYDPRTTDTIALTGTDRLYLCVQVAENHGNWGPSGKVVSVHHLDQSFTEGNGKSWGLSPAQRERGEGKGVTWSCPEDEFIENSAANCPGEGWSGGEFGEAISQPPVTITNGTGTGPNASDRFVAFDLTQWAKDNPSTALRFLVKKVNDGAPGRIDFHSKDAALAHAQANPTPADPFGIAPPTLIVGPVDVAPNEACAAPFRSDPT